MGIARLLLLVLTTATLPAAELELHFTPQWQGTPLELPQKTYATATGQTLRISRFSALVSGFALLGSDGSVVQLDGQQGFLDAVTGRLTVALTGVPPGDYQGLQVQIGVPAPINHGDPARWPAGHPLNPLVNGLHWSWQGGYVFLALEGFWRDGPGVERGFSYHLATDERLMTVRFLSPFAVRRQASVELAFNVAALLAKTHFAPDDGSVSTHSAPTDALGAELAHAAERALFWLGATEVPGSAAATSNAAGGRPALVPASFRIPPGFPQPALPADNPITDAGAQLGRRLFHDPRLSGNGTQSCASCHSPRRAFSDSVALSRGADGGSGARNAMPLFNLAWHPAYAWDGARPRIRDQALAAMTNPVEMNATAIGVVADLSGDEDLRADFAAAFGTPEISVARVGLALEQFLLTLVSADSRFDRSLRGQAELTAEEQRGFELFATEYDPARGRRGADCFHCHGGALFTDYGYRSNGLDRAGADAGLAKVTARAGDRGKFKTPSLRNVALTAPYMHDGRFATLEEVIAHYDHGVQRSPVLDPNLGKHPDAGLALTAEDQRALVAFLKTLTDERFAHPPAPPRLAASVP